jgi:hypothetical protein
VSNDADQQEEAARKFFKWNEEFLDWVWKKGRAGKIAVSLYIITSVAPSLLNGYAILLLWFRFYPLAVSLTEQLEVLGILIALANAEVLAVRWFLIQVMLYAYMTRRRRRRKTDGPGTSIAN